MSRSRLLETGQFAFSPAHVAAPLGTVPAPLRCRYALRSRPLWIADRAIRFRSREGPVISENLFHRRSGRTRKTDQSLSSGRRFETLAPGSGRVERHSRQFAGASFAAVGQRSAPDGSNNAA